MNGKAVAIVGTLMAVKDTMTARLEKLRREIAQLGLALGLPPPDDSPVIDVGEAPTTLTGKVAAIAKVVSRGVLAVVAIALLGFALWSLGMFVSASLVAFVVMTRGLGLRIEVPRAAAA